MVVLFWFSIMSKLTVHFRKITMMSTIIIIIIIKHQRLMCENTRMIGYCIDDEENLMMCLTMSMQ